MSEWKALEQNKHNTLSTPGLTIHGNFWYHWVWKLRLYLGKFCFTINLGSGWLGSPNCWQVTATSLFSAFIFIILFSLNMLLFAFFISALSYLSSFLLHVHVCPHFYTNQNIFNWWILHYSTCLNATISESEYFYYPGNKEIVLLQLLDIRHSKYQKKKAHNLK